MLTKSLCIALLCAAIVQANPIRPASRIYRSANNPDDYLNLNYQITYDLSGHPVMANESKGGSGNESKVAEKPGGKGGFLHNFSKSVKNTIDERVSSHDEKVDSVLTIGRSTLDAVRTITDSNVNRVAAVPKVGLDALKEIGRK